MRTETEIEKVLQGEEGRLAFHFRQGHTDLRILGEVRMLRWVLDQPCTDQRIMEDIQERLKEEAEG